MTLLREIPDPHMFHGNCFDIMSDEERIPTRAVNLILNDPPLRVRLADTTTSRQVLLVFLLALSALAENQATWIERSPGGSTRSWQGITFCSTFASHSMG